MQHRIVVPPSPIYANPKYRCLCGTHVEQGARIIAIVGTAPFVIAAVGALVAHSPWYTPLGQLLPVVFYLSILYAQHKRDPVLYLPYLYATAFALLGLALLCIALAMALLMGPTSDWRVGLVALLMETFGFEFHPPSNEEDDLKTQWQIVVGVMLFILCVLLAVNAFFYWVIFSACCYLRDEQKMNLSSQQVVYYRPEVSRVAPCAPYELQQQQQVIIMDKPPPRYESHVNG